MILIVEFEVEHFLGNVIHVHVRYMSSVRLLSVSRLFVMFVHPTLAIEIFDNFSRPFYGRRPYTFPL